MKALTFFIHLREPLLVAKAQNDEPNSSSTELFIPGSAIRGALIGRYLERPEKHGIDLMQDDDARQLFFSDEVLFLNAYLLHFPSRTRLLPRPLSWFVDKDKRHDPEADIYDLALAFQEQKKSPKTGDFVYQPKETVYLATPKIKTVVHNLSLDRNRKGKGMSNVFRYDSLAEGQWFAGAIISENAGALTPLQAFLQRGDFKVGGSHTGGYGWIHLDAINLQENWTEYDLHQSPYDAANVASNEIIVTLLSDAIVRGENGQINGNFDEGLALALDLKPESLRHVKAFQEHKLVGGFNRKWGLPLPQALAVKAGSVFVYEKEKLDWEVLQKIAAHGIGERRNEGFGRIAIDWYKAKSWEQQEFKTGSSLAKPIDLRTSSESRALANRMAKNRLRAQLDQQLIKIVSKVNWKKETSLSHLAPAQLSQMRLAASRAIHEKSLNSITVQINQIETHRSAGERWQKVRLGEERFLNWLNRWASLSADDFIREFELRDLPQVAGIPAELSEDLRQKYCARVIDGVTRKAIKVLQKGEEGDEEYV